ncbi:type I secretion C-terminal target domain-containing protein [Parendozoicomonas haliclonae]|uniref:Uncharacterized protein n=1 Tax=Parendozoicomonas haliclonae TaxID=1960125 RepID=A0A1X7AQM1_9GAMM|nr:type I secretion C-terminal target domain-containing protein [Parendozoicomonas haliclonae]SMA50535.1 hypothetical protein EHSB41UT_04346 [Parendozoicomonas haliclonae]
MADSYAAIGQAVIVNGAVMLRLADGTLQPLDIEADLKGGEKIALGPDGQLIVQLADGTILQLPTDALSGLSETLAQTSDEQESETSDSSEEGLVDPSAPLFASELAQDVSPDSSPIITPSQANGNAPIVNESSFQGGGLGGGELSRGGQTPALERSSALDSGSVPFSAPALSPVDLSYSGGSFGSVISAPVSVSGGSASNGSAAIASSGLASDSSTTPVLNGTLNTQAALNNSQGSVSASSPTSAGTTATTPTSPAGSSGQSLSPNSAQTAVGTSNTQPATSSTNAADSQISDSSPSSPTTPAPASPPAQTPSQPDTTPPGPVTAQGETLSVAANQSAVTNSLASQGLLANDSTTVQGASLVVSHVGGTEIAKTGATTIQGTYGNLLIAQDGTYSYVPLNSASGGGTDTFTYTVSDGTNTGTATLTVDVLATGFATLDSATVHESSMPGNYAYSFDTSQGRLAMVNLDNGQVHLLGNVQGLVQPSGYTAYTLAQSPSGELYAVTHDTIYTINTSTLQATAVSSHSMQGVPSGTTFGPDGTLYVLHSSGEIRSVDPATGEATLLGDITGLDSFGGDLAWHDGQLYTVGYAYSYMSGNGESFSALVGIDVSDGSFTPTVSQQHFPSNVSGGLVSLGGNLYGLDDTSAYQIDTTTGSVSESTLTALNHSMAATSVTPEQTAGNLLTNDTSATSVSQIATANGGSAQTVGTDTVVQGTYGTLTISADGSYSYALDNTRDATNNLTGSQTGNERFVYTALNGDGESSQSVLTFYVNGSDEVSVAPPATFTSYQRIDNVSPSDNSFILDFNITTNSVNEKITGLRIDNMYSSDMNAPDALTSIGTATNNYADWVWTANAGNNAGLDSFDARASGLTMTGINNTGSTSMGQEMQVTVTVSEYDDSGNLIGSRDTLTAIEITLVPIDGTLTGTDGDDTLAATNSSGNTDGNNQELIGGAGNDTLTGNNGADFFIWRAADVGTGASPAIDTVTDFDKANQGDVLDLRDLLPDNAAGNLTEYLSFNFADGDTTINISTTAGGDTVQKIVLDGVDLSSQYGTSDSTTLINNLTDDGHLLT